MASLLVHCGVSADQKALASGICDVSRGANGGDLLLCSKRKGLSAVSFNGTASMLKKLISRGYPVIVLQDVSRSERLGHFRIVVGYDDFKGVFVLRDNTRRRLLEQAYGEFDLLWGRHGRWGLIMDSGKANDLVSPENPVMNMDLAGAYLRAGDRVRAEVECRKALAREPGNPFARDLLKRIRTS